MAGAGRIADEFAFWPLDEHDHDLDIGHFLDRLRHRGGSGPAQYTVLQNGAAEYSSPAGADHSDHRRSDAEHRDHYQRLQHRGYGKLFHSQRDDPESGLY